MNGGSIIRLFAWAIALTLVALPIVGVLNGWFASERWPVTRLAVRAEFDHVSAEQIRAAAEPKLGQGFFAMQLDEVRDAVARLPWVERVEARKRWPDTVELVVYEQQPYAHWSEGRLVNRAGQLFDVPGGESLQGLPRLAGPDDRLDDVLRFYSECLRELGGSGLVLDSVNLSPRGSWRLHLGAGTVIELGRADAMEHLKRFLDVWPRIASTRTQPPLSVDLRHANGFAVRWEGRDSGLEIRDSEEPAAIPLASKRLDPRWSLASLWASSYFAIEAPIPNRGSSSPESRIPNLSFSNPESRPL